MLFVYDGHRLLVHDPEKSRPWSLYEKPEEHPNQFARLDMFTAPGSPEFAKGCQSAKPFDTSASSVATLSATTARPTSSPTGAAPSRSPMARPEDQRSAGVLPASRHVVRRAPRHHCSKLLHPAPAARRCGVCRTQHASDAPKKAPDFALNHVKGTSGTGTVSLSDYTHKPLVLAFFSSDLAFGTRTALDVWTPMALTQLTHDGTNPAVLAVQTEKQAKPGYPLIPKSLDVDVVVNHPDSTCSIPTVCLARSVRVHRRRRQRASGLRQGTHH